MGTAAVSDDPLRSVEFGRRASISCNGCSLRLANVPMRIHPAAEPRTARPNYASNQDVH